MLSRNQASHLRSLQQHKFRKLHRQFIAEGVKLAGELLESRYIIHEIYALRAWLDQHGPLLEKRHVRFQEVSEQELDRISQLVTPNEVLLVVEIPEDVPGPVQLSDLVLFLDRIQDPGNMGTILRTADWFGVNTVVCSPGCADIYNPKVVQASMGSITRVKVVERDAEEFLAYAGKTSRVYGAMAGGEDVYRMQKELPAVIIIGNESQGIGENLLPYIHHKAGIPRFSDKAESLNAAIATSIFLSEFRRPPG